MAKKKSLNAFLMWVGWIVGLLTSLAIGGSFLNGSFMDVFILNMFPMIVHQIIGWTIIGLAGIAVFVKLFSLAK